MKRIISLLLLLSIIASVMLFTVSCSLGDETPDDDMGNNGDSTDEGTSGDGGQTIVVPAYKDYGRETVDFEKLTYKRPDIAAGIDAFEAATLAIEQNKISFEAQLDLVYKLEEPYTNIRSMNALASIYFSKDSSSDFWAGEDAYIGQNYPSFSQAIENLFVAAANSPHAQRFEEEYFGDGLIEEYRDGGDYTDELVELLEKEATLENEYNSISTSNVYITYGDMHDTVDNVLAFYRDYYGEGTDAYKSVVEVCNSLYYYASQDAMVPIYVEILKVRRLIADELSLESYTSYAYETLYHDYSPEVATEFLNEVSTYIVPIYSQLAYSLGPVLNTPPVDMYTDTATLLNTLYEIYGDMDGELSDIYNYMLQHDLYDVTHEGENRLDGAFTTYIESNNSPYLFVTSDRKLYDYMTVAHEFGHFTDYFVNFGGGTSLDLTEVYSSALEYLTLLEMKDAVSSDAYRYLLYYQLNTAFEVLLVQGFYAMFEDEAYKLDYDEITVENLELIAKRAGARFSLNTSFVSDISKIMIDHLMLYPFYVQSYCTSLVVALQIYVLETEDEGEGLEAYKELLKRPEGSFTFEELLSLAGLESPFGDNVLRDVANEIYFIVTGSYYYQIQHDDTNAA